MKKSSLTFLTELFQDQNKTILLILEIVLIFFLSMQFQLSFNPLLKRTIFLTDETVLVAAHPLWLSSTEIFIYLIFTEIRVDKDFQPVNFSNQKLLKTQTLKNSLA